MAAHVAFAQHFNDEKRGGVFAGSLGVSPILLIACARQSYHGKKVARMFGSDMVEDGIHLRSRHTAVTQPSRARLKGGWCHPPTQRCRNATRSGRRSSSPADLPDAAVEGGGEGEEERQREVARPEVREGRGRGCDLRVGGGEELHRPEAE